MRPITSLQLTRIVLSVALLSAAVAYVVLRGDWSLFGGALSQLSPLSLAITALLIVAGTLLASLRLQLIARDLGYSLHFRDAAAALSIGQLGGALFFQVVGQLLARGAFLSRRSVPVSGTIVATGYERLLAAAVSVVLAVSGAIYLFGHISFDEERGGLLVVKLVLGVLSAGLGAALLAWGRVLWPRIPRISKHIVLSTVRNLVLSILIQMMTMGAYVVLANSIAPNILTMKLVAASTLVMLGASLPISLAGWGMREMSAILALGMIGISTEASLAIAVTVGLTSIFVVAAVTLVTVGTHWRTPGSAKAEKLFHVDYGMLLDYALPLAAASAVFIQAFFPLQKGLINVNLADPFAIIGGCLFVIHHVGRRWPNWRLAHIEYYILAATAVIVASFLHGLSRFGWTDWAFANKGVGWFVLLGYGACGALIVSRAKRDGLDLMLRTYAASALSIVAVGIALLTLARSGLSSLTPIIGLPLEGFSANRNAFAFQLLLAVCAVCAGRWPKSEFWLGMLFAGLLLTGSRAGLLGLLVVVAMTFYLRIMTVRTICIACALGIGLFVVVDFGPNVLGYLISAITGKPHKAAVEIARIVATPDEAPRILSLVGGWTMFLSHPFIGAGLGAFIYEQVRASNQLIIHSTPLWLLAETGIVGFVIIATPLFRLFYREITNVHIRDLGGIMLILIIAAFGVEANAHEMLYQRAFWLLLGAGLACMPTQARKPHR